MKNNDAWLDGESGKSPGMNCICPHGPKLKRTRSEFLNAYRQSPNVYRTLSLQTNRPQSIMNDSRNENAYCLLNFPRRQSLTAYRKSPNEKNYLWFKACCPASTTAYTTRNRSCRCIRQPYFITLTTSQSIRQWLTPKRYLSECRLVPLHRRSTTTPFYLRLLHKRGPTVRPNERY